jgi:hypothetical protein
MPDERVGRRIAPAYEKSQTPGVRIDSGPYIGIVKNNVDPLRHGRLHVYIPELGGAETDIDNWKWVNYASPFFGEVDPSYGKKDKNTENTYGSTTQSYGMWMVPPDLGVNVLVTFVNGSPDKGYWFACIPMPKGHYMVPAIGGSAQADKDPAPVTEFNVNKDALYEKSDFLNNKKPTHKIQSKILDNQGLNKDYFRGLVSSSSQRESPSKVLGISTPGRPDPDPALKSDQITPDPNFKSDISNENRAKIESAINPKTRKGGHSLVFDDGDLLGNNQLIRMRSASGHQIMMNDTAGIIYVVNAAGTAWVELTPDGSINVFSSKTLNIRAEDTVNLHADKDIKIHAGNNITMYAKNNLIVNGNNILQKARSTFVADAAESAMLVSDGTAIVFGQNKNLILAGSKVQISGGKVDTSASSNSKPASVPSLPEKEFPDTTKTDGKWAEGGDTVPSTVGVLPTHEPWKRPTTQIDKIAAELENAKPDSPAAPGGGAVVVGTGTGPPLTDGSGNPVRSGSAPPDDSAISSAKTRGVSGSKNKIVTAQEVAGQADPPNSTIGNLSQAEKKALLAQIGKSESGNNYTAVERTNGNYLGKYQVGAAALTDQGYIKPEAYKKYGTSAVQYPDAWTGKDGINSKNDFLTNPAVQEKAMDQNLQNNYKAMARNGAIQPGDSPSTVAGMLQTAHLLGAGGANNWRRGGGGADANGTTGEAYFNQGRAAVEIAAAGAQKQG